MLILPVTPVTKGGQARFIGLDLHSTEIQAHVTLADGTALAPVRFVTSASNIELLRQELTAQDAVAMEATFNAFAAAKHAGRDAHPGSDEERALLDTHPLH